MPIKSRIETSGLRAERIDFRGNLVFYRNSMGTLVQYSGYRLTWFQKLSFWIKKVFKD